MGSGEDTCLGVVRILCPSPLFPARRRSLLLGGVMVWIYEFRLQSQASMNVYDKPTRGSFQNMAPLSAEALDQSPNASSRGGVMLMVLIARIDVEVSNTILGARRCAEIDDRVPVSIKKPEIPVYIIEIASISARPFSLNLPAMLGTK